MESITVCLPASVSLSHVADILRPSLTIRDHLVGLSKKFDELYVLGDSDDSVVSITSQDARAFDSEGEWPTVVRTFLGAFVAYDFASYDFARICEAIAVVVRAGPALVADDHGHRFVSGESFLSWFDRHPHPTWTDVFDYSYIIGRSDQRTWPEMPTLATYERE